MAKNKTTAPDGESVDVFIGPHPELETVFVVNQVHPDTHKYDEPKVMLGYRSPEEAREAYAAHYPADWPGFGSMVAMSMPQFKVWLEKGDTSRPVKQEEVEKFGGEGSGIRGHTTTKEYHLADIYRKSGIPPGGSMIQATEPNPMGYDLQRYPKSVDGPKLEASVKDAVTRQRAASPFARLTLSQLKDKVAPDLSQHDFASSLAKMHKDGKIELGAWTGSHATIPDVRQSVPLDRSIKWYVGPSQASTPHAEYSESPPPDKRQTTCFTCGVSATQSVIEHFTGEKISESDLARELGTTPEDGTNWQAIEKALTSRGLKVDAFFFSEEPIAGLRYFTEGGALVICAVQMHGTPTEHRRLESGHWVSVWAVDEAGVHYQDPSRVGGGRQVMSAEEWLADWRDEEGGNVLERLGLVVSKPGGDAESGGVI